MAPFSDGPVLASLPSARSLGHLPRILATNMVAQTKIIAFAGGAGLADRRDTMEHQHSTHDLQVGAHHGHHEPNTRFDAHPHGPALAAPGFDPSPPALSLRGHASVPPVAPRAQSLALPTSLQMQHQPDGACEPLCSLHRDCHDQGIAHSFSEDKDELCLRLAQSRGSVPRTDLDEDGYPYIVHVWNACRLALEREMLRSLRRSCLAQGIEYSISDDESHLCLRLTQARLASPAAPAAPLPAVHPVAAPSPAEPPTVHGTLFRRSRPRVPAQCTFPRTSPSDSGH